MDHDAPAHSNDATALGATTDALTRLDHKVAIATGAGGGIGGATSRLLAALGAHVVAVDIDEEAAARTADDVRAAGRDALAIGIDLAGPDAGPDVVDQTLRRFGHVDIIVNNAATGTRQDFGSVDVEAWDRVIATNLRTPFLLIQAAAPAMIERGQGGRIVNVTSAAGFRATMTEPVYAASKAGLDAVTRSLAAALGPHGINVNAVAPGLTSSRMGRRLGDDAALQRAVEEGPLENLLRRVSTPDDVAAVIVFLCQPASRQITAQTIHTSAGNVV